VTTARVRHPTCWHEECSRAPSLVEQCSFSHLYYKGWWQPMLRPVTGTAVLLAARRRVATLENTPRGFAHPRSSAASVRSGVGAIVILGGTEYWLD